MMTIIGIQLLIGLILIWVLYNSREIKKEGYPSEIVKKKVLRRWHPIVIGILCFVPVAGGVATVICLINALIELGCGDWCWKSSGRIMEWLMKEI